jgi:hypothetical protein
MVQYAGVWGRGGELRYDVNVEEAVWMKDQDKAETKA